MRVILWTTVAHPGQSDGKCASTSSSSSCVGRDLLGPCLLLSSAPAFVCAYQLPITCLGQPEPPPRQLLDTHCLDSFQITQALPSLSGNFPTGLFTLADCLQMCAVLKWCGVTSQRELGAAQGLCVASFDTLSGKLQERWSI